MNKEMILKSDILDILFENRNKHYGAYNLRKFYSNRLTKATGAMFAIVAVLSAFTFLPEKKVYEASNYIIPKDPEMGHIKPPDPKQPEVKPKTTVAVQKNMTTQKWVSKIVMVHLKDSADKLPNNLDNTAIGSVTINTPHTGGPQIIVPVNTGGGEITKPVIPVIDKTKPVYNAEIMPAYPGGMDALRKFLERNLQNPKDLEAGEMVSVKIKFIVGYDGKLQGFETVQDGGDAFNNEVVRVLKKMPEWVPGRSNGENISVYYTIPVKFVPAE